MKAVNLIPQENRSNRTIKTGTLGLGHAVLAFLLVAVAFASIYVLTKNTVSDRQAKLTALNTEVSQAETVANGLSQYTAFAQAAQQRTDTVRTIIASRFDWQTALTELSRVLPSNTAVGSIFGTVVPGAAVGGAGGAGASTGALRSAINVPAFEISGCTGSQDEVANLMSRLRLINGVTRVTLSDSQKPVPSISTNGTSSTSKGICGGHSPAWDLVVFFTAIPNAGTEGILTQGATGAVGPVTPIVTTGQTAGGSQ